MKKVTFVRKYIPPKREPCAGKRTTIRYGTKFGSMLLPASQWDHVIHTLMLTLTLTLTLLPLCARATQQAAAAGGWLFRESLPGVQLPACLPACLPRAALSFAWVCLCPRRFSWCFVRAGFRLRPPLSFQRPVQPPAPEDRRGGHVSPLQCAARDTAAFSS
jgi:hypothetical protein